MPVAAPRASSLATAGALSFLGLAVLALSRFGTNLVIGHVGGPHVLGLTSTALAAAQLLSLLWPSSTGTAASKFLASARARDDSDGLAATARHLRNRIVQTSIGLAFLAIPVWLWLDGPPIRNAFALSFIVFSLSLYGFVKGAQYGMGRATRASTFDVAIGVVSFVGVVALAAKVHNAGLLLLIPLALCNLVYALIAWPRGHRASLSPGRRLRRDVDGFVALSTIGTLASYGVAQVAIVLVRQVDGRGAAGIYAAALNLALPTTLVVSALSLVLLPSMAGSSGLGSRDALRRRGDLATRVVIALMLPAIGTLALLSNEIVSLIWGEPFSASAGLLPVLLYAALVNGVAMPSVNALAAGERRDFQAAVGASIAGAVVCFLVWAAFAGNYGATAVAVGYLLSNATTALVCMALFWSRIRPAWFSLGLRSAACLATTVVLLAVKNGLSIDEPDRVALLVIGHLLSCALLLRAEVALTANALIAEFRR